jgi:hypothetical protein
MPDSARNDVWAQGAGSYGKIHLTARAWAVRGVV